MLAADGWIRLPSALSGLWPLASGLFPLGSEGACIAADGVEDAPERGATALFARNVGDHAVECAGLAERAQGPLIELHATNEVGDVGERAIFECALEPLARRGAEPADETEAETNPRR